MEYKNSENQTLLPKLTPMKSLIFKIALSH